MSYGDAIRDHYRLAGFKAVACLFVAKATGLYPLLKIESRPYPLYARAGTADLGVYEGILLGGEYDNDFGSPEIIVDAGAHIGMAAIFFARKYPNAKIFSIEAEPSNFAVLRKNIVPYPKIVPLHAALWNEDGNVLIESARRTDAFRVGDSGHLVESITVPSLMSRFGLPRIDVLKMDIEGAEKEVFSAPNWINSVGMIAVETHGEESERSVKQVTGEFSVFRRRETLFLSRFYRCA